MQDRFKFRVWEKDQKIMKECTQITLDKDQTGSMCDVKGKVTAHLVYQPHYILMQSTGLKDKNGKLIFEGDIIKVGNGSINGSVIETTREVKWIINTWNVPVWVVDKPDFSHYVQVIGNVYENKELLNEVGN